jgi:hypothetical protein
VKSETNNKHRIYLKPLLDLRTLIETEYADGGWLPSERMMCDKLGVSRMTYRKVISWLVTEALVRSVPRRGHWVVEKSLRRRKIGIVMSNGTESPFLSYGNFLARVLDGLDAYHLKAHLIQSSRLENIHVSAVSHAVEGLIWLHPPTEAYDTIRAIQADGIPVVSVSYKMRGTEEMLRGLNYAAMDFVASTGNAAKDLIRRGCRRILFLGSDDYDAEPELASVFADAGRPFSRDWIITEISELENKLKTLGETVGFDAVISDGGWERVEALLKYCRTLPTDKRPELVLPCADNIANNYKKYSDIHISGFQNFGNLHLAETATAMLVDCLNEGKAMSSVLKPAYVVQFEDETCVTQNQEMQP